jgi:hypothetical protein
MTPERARLAAALRELRAATGLSMAGLAARTAYSKSSWERYLKGRMLPPRQAVRELCRLATEPEGRCLALWEITESEWSGRGAGAPAAGAPPAGASAADAPAPVASPPLPTPSPPSADADPIAVAVAVAPKATPAGHPGHPGHPGHRAAVLMAVLASVCAVALGGVTIALLLLPRHGGGPESSALQPSPGPYCRGASCEGRSPMEAHCAASPATLAERRTASGAWLEVRYSRECGTSWARMWGTRVGDRLEVRAGGRVRGREVLSTADADSFLYTPMTVAQPGAVLRTCFRPVSEKLKKLKKPEKPERSKKEECFTSVAR